MSLLRQVGTGETPVRRKRTEGQALGHVGRRKGTPKRQPDRSKDLPPQAPGQTLHTGSRQGSLLTGPLALDPLYKVIGRTWEIVKKMRKKYMGERM